MNVLNLFRSLQNPRFAILYAAQTISLLGDALTWLGLALLAFELVGNGAAVVLATALTLRVTAFVLFAPLAGTIADRFDRKQIMVVTHAMRMVIVACLPFVVQIWQIYVLIFCLNIVNAFFTPTYKATIPLVTGKQDYPQAIALSSATNQLLGVLGPGIAGGMAAVIGARQVFFLDALTFLTAGILILILPGKLSVQSNLNAVSDRKTWRNIQHGTTRLFANPQICYGLFMQLVGSIAGAQILVNSVGYVQGTLKLGKIEYGWVMAAFGIGATIAAAIVGSVETRLPRTKIILFGGILIGIALLPANYSNLPGLIGLWLLAGIAENSINLPTQTLIADHIPTNVQGRVYGAHFAWSHLWWLFSYPLAGWLGRNFMNQAFLYAGLLALFVFAIVQIVFSSRFELGRKSGNTNL